MGPTGTPLGYTQYRQRWEELAKPAGAASVGPPSAANMAAVVATAPDGLAGVDLSAVSAVAAAAGTAEQGLMLVFEGGTAGTSALVGKGWDTATS